MFSGFYTAASGVLTNQRALNLNANNMANVKTPGYREQRLVKTTFEEELLRVQGGKSTAMGSGAILTAAAEQAFSFAPGELTQTGGAYDLALGGDGYFVLQGENGEYLTRNGNFRMDAEGYLSLNGIGRLMGENGPIRPQDGFQVDEQGTVRSEKGDVLGKLRIVVPDASEKLQFYEKGMFGAGEAQLAPAASPVIQGSLEGSNVDLSAEMTRTMEIQRAFQSCSKALTIIDQMNQKTASEIGKL